MISNTQFPTRVFIAITLIIMLVAILFGSPFSDIHIVRALSNTWVVTSLVDDSNSNCSGMTYSGTNCELRDAIAQATAGDTITFSVNGTITVNSTSGSLILSKNVTIIGSGAVNLTVDGNAAITIFTVQSGVTVSLTGITVQNGSTATDGGGIYNAGSLTIWNSVIKNNQAPNGSGGGIYNKHSITFNNSTLSNNSAVYGGGLEIFGLDGNIATATINNSLVSDNSVPENNNFSSYPTLDLAKSGQGRKRVQNERGRGRRA